MDPIDCQTQRKAILDLLVDTCNCDDIMVRLKPSVVKTLWNLRSNLSGASETSTQLMAMPLSALLAASDRVRTELRRLKDEQRAAKAVYATAWNYYQRWRLFTKSMQDVDSDTLIEDQQ